METTEVVKQMFEELLLKTIEGKVNWTVLNPNAIRWIKSRGPQPMIVTLQKQPSPNPAIRENYVMTIQSQSTTPMQLNTVTETALKEVFVKLYNEATKEAVRTNESIKLEVIKNLLKDL